jgi:hypothetical protein
MNFEGERFDAPGQYFTADQPTWNSAAVVLAAHALDGDGPTAGMFRGEGLPIGLTVEQMTAAGIRISGEGPAGYRPPARD